MAYGREAIFCRRPKEDYLKFHHSLMFWFLASASGLVFTYYYFLYTNEYPGGSYERMAVYEADKVFQTRMLITSLANFLEPSIPVLRETMQWAVPYSINYEVLLQLINAFFLTGLILITPNLLLVLGCKINHFTSFFILLPIAWNYIAINGLIDGAGLYYPYDIPALTFFAIGTILFCRQKWLLFYPAFFLACLNRESACFITLAGFCILFTPFKVKSTNWIKENKTILSHVVVQATIWVLSRICLSYTFRDNPGSFFESPHSMIQFITTIGTGESHWAMQNPIWFLTLFAGIWVIPLVYLKRLNNRTRRLLMVGGVYLAVLAFRSNMMETRVYNELNIILGACCLSLFARSYSEEEPENDHL